MATKTNWSPSRATSKTATGITSPLLHHLLVDRRLASREMVAAAMGGLQPVLLGEILSPRVGPLIVGPDEMGVSEDHPVLASLTNGDHAYFVHSFAMQCTDEKHVLATTEYGGQIAAIVGRDNLLGTQFHPEKSQATGISLLNNFLQWRP